MGKVFAFHGGIHPPQNKQQSTGLAIQPGPVPKTVRLPVQQHIGAPAQPVVEVGQRVLKGQLIAEPGGRLSAAIHASVSGTVTAIGMMQVAHSSGMDALCIEIENDRQDEWVPHAGLEDYRSLNSHDLADYIRGKGVAGMGGAGFPTDVKLHVGDHHIINTLVINAAECEPYITADDMLMRERADQVIAGIEVICHMLKPSHVMIGIEDNKPQAITALQQAALGNRHPIDVVVVPTKYPSGGEKQLIKLLTGVEVPSGGIPADVGIVCQNVGTAVAIHRAVAHGEPLISRVVTMTGDAVARPHNMEVAIGTPFVDLLDQANLKENHLARLVVGGPMMGFSVNDDELPITKTTNCLIAATWEEMPEANPAQPCIRCGQCEQACPVELLPQQLHWFAKGREFDKAKNHNLFDCIECGACSYVCPSEIPLVQYYRFAKAEIRNEEAETRKAEHAKKRFEARVARQEAEAAEKEARRKQRAEAAVKAQAVKKDKLEAEAAKPAVATEDAAPVMDLKALKTAAAVTRTKLRQAEKALKNAETKGLDGVETLAQTVATLQAKADAAQKAYDEAQNPPAAAAPVLDLKQLKTNAAVARTKLRQAEKALAKAQDSGEGDIAALQAKLAEQQAKTELAQAAYDNAESGGAAPAAAPAISAEQLAELKADWDAAQAKVAKAQAALDTAIANESPAAEKMKAGVAKLQAKADEAKKAYDDAASPATAATTPAVSAEQLAELQADVDGMTAKVSKAQAALDTAIANESPAAEKMKAGVAKLQAKLDEARAELAKAQAPVAAPAAPAVSAAQLAELQADVDGMTAKVSKAQAALDTAIANESPAAEKMKAGVAKLQARLDEAVQALQAAGGEVAEAVAEPEPEPELDLKALKQQVSIMRTKLRKVEKAVEAAEEAGDDTTELVAEQAQLQQRFEAAKAQFDAGEAALVARAAEEGVDLKQLKIDAAMARAAVTKAERALAKVTEPDDQQEKLAQALEAAKQKAEQLNSTLSRFE